MKYRLGIFMCVSCVVLRYAGATTTHTVTSPATFQSALDAARTNSDDDILYVYSAYYDINSTLTYEPAASDDNHQLSIIGVPPAASCRRWTAVTACRFCGSIPRK